MNVPINHIHQGPSTLAYPHMKSIQYLSNSLYLAFSLSTLPLSTPPSLSTTPCLPLFSLSNWRQCPVWRASLYFIPFSCLTENLPTHLTHSSNVRRFTRGEIPTSSFFWWCSCFYLFLSGYKEVLPKQPLNTLWPIYQKMRLKLLFLSERSILSYPGHIWEQSGSAG